MLHIGVPSLVFLIVLCLQLATFKRLVRYYDQGARELKVCEVQSIPARTSFAWLHWIGARLEAARGRNEVITRQLALDELEWSIAHDQNYVGLQRIGISAPVIGVLITASLFWAFQLPTDTPAGTNDVVGMVKPLILGVGVGALLAIINQALLFWAGFHINGLRLAVRNWLDGRPDVRDAADAIVVNATKSVTRLETVSTQHLEHARALEQAIRGVKETTSEFTHTIRNLGPIMGDLQAMMGQSREASSETYKLIQETAFSGRSAFNELVVVATQVRQATTDHLLPAIESQAQFRDSFVRASEHLGGMAEKLEDISGQLGATTEAYRGALEGFNTSWQETILPAHSLANSTIDQLRGESEALSESVRGLTESVSQISTHFARTEPALSAIEFGANSLNRAITAQSEAAASWEDGTRKLLGIVETSTAASTDTLEWSKKFGENIKEWLQLLENDIRPGAHDLRSSASRLLSTTSDLDSSIAASVGELQAATAALLALPIASMDSMTTFKEAMSTFSTIIATDFRSAAILQASSAKSMAESADTSHSAQAAIQSSTEFITKSLTSLQNATLAIEKNQVELLKAATTFSDNGAQLQSFADTTLGNSVNSLQETTAALQRTVTDFNQVIHFQFLPAARNLGVIAAALQERQLASANKNGETAHRRFFGLLKPKRS